MSSWWDEFTDFFDTGLGGRFLDLFKDGEGGTSGLADLGLALLVNELG